MPRGRFLVLEGIDGAGTTTQTAELARRLRARGVPAVATAEPSRGPVGSLVRLALQGRLTGPVGRELDRTALALLFAADRLDHVACEVLPRLAEGAWVVSDRYVLSSLAYQTLDVPQAFVESINARAPAPDLTLFLEVPPEVALRRRRAEGPPAEIFEKLPLQRRIAALYRRAIAAGAARGPVRVVDGTLGIAAVADELERLVASRFKLAGEVSRRPGSGRRRTS
ncbi:MAG: dTMP kinase [Myxococcales bacterium]